MKPLLLSIVALLFIPQTQAQTILNGDFENNNNTCQYNITNATYNSSMQNSTGFGTASQLDIISSSCGYGAAQNGNWFVAMATDITGTQTDAFSLTLSAPLTINNSYTLTYYDRKDPGYATNPIEIGISASASSFGTQIFLSPAPVLGWTQHTVTFTASVAATYITIHVIGTVYSWTHVDNFSITASGASPLQVNAAAQFATCFGICNGSATATATGGTPPYHYLWSTTNDTTATTNSLCAGGSYHITVTDALGASAADSVFLPVIDPLLPVNLNASVSVMCAGDTALVCAPSGFVSYQWNTGDTSVCVYAQQAGNYYVTVTDQNNCTIESNHLPIAVHPLPPVSISVNGDTLSAYNAVSYQWYVNSNAISGGTNTFYIANQPGSYTVQVTDSNGCHATSNAVVVTGIADFLNPNSAVLIYPNPNSTGIWQLQVEEEWLDSRLEVLDATGRLVFNSTLSTQHSTLSFEAATGVYVLHIYNNRKAASVKLVKW